MPTDPTLNREGAHGYSARDAYMDYAIGVDYERVRVSGVLGRYRRWREEAAARALLQRIPNDITILDCPCVTGRWWPLLSTGACEINIGSDG